MAVSLHPVQQTLWDSVLQLTKSAQDKNSDPLLWAIQLSSSLNSAGVMLPSTELAHLLVSYICFENNVPITWKFLEKALAVQIAPPMLVLALLSARHVHSLAHAIFKVKLCTNTHSTLHLTSVSFGILLNMAVLLGVSSLFPLFLIRRGG